MNKEPYWLTNFSQKCKTISKTLCKSFNYDYSNCCTWYNILLVTNNSSFVLLENQIRGGTWYLSGRILVSFIVRGKKNIPSVITQKQTSSSSTTATTVTVIWRMPPTNHNNNAVGYLGSEWVFHKFLEYLVQFPATNDVHA